MVRPLRPLDNFERLYQGKDGTIPIAFPGTLDLFAQRGRPGYDPNLMGAATVPVGSQVTLWIPLTLAGYIITNAYRYQILWRYRSVKDYLTGQAEGQVSAAQSYSSYHLKANPFGQPEVNGSPRLPANARHFLPGAPQTAALRQDLPDPDTGGASIITLRGELLQPVASPVWSQPLTPSGANGIWQQGVYLGSSQVNTGGPSFMTYSTIARGDEMAIYAYKIPPGEGMTQPWDFTDSDFDLAFSNTYGNNNGQNLPGPTAILVTTGTP